MSNLVRRLANEETAPDAAAPIVPIINTNPALAAPRQELSTKPLVDPTAEFTAPVLDATPLNLGGRPTNEDITPEKLDVEYAPDLPETTFNPLQFPIITNPGPDVMFEGPSRTELKAARQYIVPEAQFVQNFTESMLAPPVDSDNDPIFQSTGEAYTPWWERMMGGLGSTFEKAWGSTDNREGGPLEIIQDRLVNGPWWQRLPFFQVPQLRDAANRAIDSVQTRAPNPDFGSGPLGAAFYGLSLPQNLGMGIAADLGKSAAETFYGVTGSTDINPRTWDIRLQNLLPGNREPNRRLPSPDGVPLPYTVRALLGTDMGFSNLQQSGTGSFNPFGVIAADEANLGQKSDAEILARAVGGFALDMVTGGPFDTVIAGARRQAARVVDEPGGALVVQPRVYDGELVQPGRALPPANRLPSGTRRVDIPSSRVDPPALPSRTQIELARPQSIVTSGTPDVKFQATGVIRNPDTYRTLFSPEFPGNVRVQVPAIRGYDVSVASVPKNVSRTIDISGRTINLLPAQVYTPQPAVADLARFVAESPVARTIDPVRMTAAPRSVPDRVRLLNAYTPIAAASSITAKTVNAITESLVTSRRFIAGTTSQIGVAVPRALPAARSFTPIVPKRLAQFTARPSGTYTREVVRQLETIMPANVVPTIPTLPPSTVAPPQAALVSQTIDSVVFNTPDVTIRAFTPDVPVERIAREVSNARVFRDAPYTPNVVRSSVERIEYEPFDGRRLTPEDDLEKVAIVAEDIIARGFVGKGLEVDDFRMTPAGEVMLIDPSRLVRVADAEQPAVFRQEVTSMVQNVVERADMTEPQMDFISAVQRTTKDLLEPSLTIHPEVYPEISQMLPDSLRTIDGSLTPEIAAHTDELVSALDQLEEFTDQLKSLESQVFETSKMVSKPFTSGLLHESRTSTLWLNADGTVSKYSDERGMDAVLRREYDTMLEQPEKPYLIRPTEWLGNGYKMPYVEGTMLHKAFDRTVEQLYAAAEDVIANIRDLDADGWVIGDLHGGNIIVTPDGTTKFIDNGENYRASTLSTNSRDREFILDAHIQRVYDIVGIAAAKVEPIKEVPDVGPMVDTWRLAAERVGLEPTATYSEVWDALPEDAQVLLRNFENISNEDILDALTVVEKNTADELLAQVDNPVTNDMVAEVRNRMALRPIPGQTPSAFINDDDVWGAMDAALFDRAAAFAGKGDIEFEHVAKALIDEPPRPAFQMEFGTPVARGRGSKAHIYANPDGTISKFIDQLTTKSDRYVGLVEDLRNEFELLQQLSDIEAFPRALEWEGNGFKMERIEGTNAVDYYGNEYTAVSNVPREQIDAVVQSVTAVAEELYQKHGMVMPDLHGANIMMQPDGKVRVIDIADSYPAGTLTPDEVARTNKSAIDALTDDLYAGQGVVGEGESVYGAGTLRATDVQDTSVVATQLGLPPDAPMPTIIDAMTPSAYDRMMMVIGDESNATVADVQRALVQPTEGVTPSVGANIPSNNTPRYTSITGEVVPRSDPGTPDELPSLFPPAPESTRPRPSGGKLETVDINGEAWQYQIRNLAKVDLPLPAEVLADFRAQGLMAGPRILDPEGLITAIRQYKEGDALRVVTGQYNADPMNQGKQLLAQAQDELEFQAQQARASAEGALNRIDAAQRRLEDAVMEHNRKVSADAEVKATESYRKRDTELGEGNRNACL